MNIDYVEFPSTNMDAMKAFYGSAFGWEFQDWGPEYVSFSKSGLEGGFRLEEDAAPRGGTIVILVTDEYEAAKDAVRNAGSELFNEQEFPGGKRFHFLDPSGNELAIWTKV